MSSKSNGQGQEKKVNRWVQAGFWVAGLTWVDWIARVEWLVENLPYFEKLGEVLSFDNLF